jgi:hypothetical protein
VRQGCRTDTITLLRLEDGALVDVERWSGRDELCYALEAPVWERFGTFVGHPPVHGDVIWTAEDSRVAIRGSRGERRFEELVG